MRTLKKIPIGDSDFREIRNNNGYYVDKTLFIAEVIENNARVILVPRPRRFGKTLNISTLHYFFECNYPNAESIDNSNLFNGLAIKKSEYFEQYQGQYPVIFITFKDIKEANFKNCLAKIKDIISEEYSRHNYLLQNNFLDIKEKKTFLNIEQKKAALPDYENSLKNLIKLLKKYHKKK